MRAFRVDVNERDEDVATALLWEAGTCGLEVQPAAGETVALVAYFPAGGTTVESLRARLPFAKIAETAVPDVDWSARFRETFRPFRVGRFAVTPAWEPSSGPDLLPLVVDPGRAFGTGTHETTRLCLAALEQVAARRPLERVIDVGAGTGILAVAAARLGASFVVASDVDPDATASSRHHARLNSVRLRVVRGDGGRPFRERSFDVVVANLTAPILSARAGEIAGLVGARGALVLSGLLGTDLLEVQAAYVACGRPRRLDDGEWVALLYEGPAG